MNIYKYTLLVEIPATEQGGANAWLEHQMANFIGMKVDVLGVTEQPAYENNVVNLDATPL